MKHLKSSNSDFSSLLLKFQWNHYCVRHVKFFPPLLKNFSQVSGFGRLTFSYLSCSCLFSIFFYPYDSNQKPLFSFLALEYHSFQKTQDISLLALEKQCLGLGFTCSPRWLSKTIHSFCNLFPLVRRKKFKALLLSSSKASHFRSFSRLKIQKGRHRPA